MSDFEAGAWPNGIFVNFRILLKNGPPHFAAPIASVGMGCMTQSRLGLQRFPPEDIQPALAAGAHSAASLTAGDEVKHGGTARWYREDTQEMQQVARHS